MTKKLLVRRTDRDRSQSIRAVVQWSFLALNVWIGIQFVLWVRYYETAGASMRVERPAGVEGWLPIAALMNLKYLVLTGEVPQVHAAGMFLLMAFLSISLLLRKAFCSWLYPIGTIGEWLWKLGRDTFRRSWALPRWADIPLRSLKYILLALFLYAVGSMGPDAIAAFLGSPYGLVADRKMLNLFRFLSIGGAITIGLLILFSVFIQNFWCRFLCPYGALMGLGLAAEPGSDTPKRRDVHRLCQVCEGVPGAPSGGQVGADPVGRMRRVHGVCRGLSRRSDASPWSDRSAERYRLGPWQPSPLSSSESAATHSTWATGKRTCPNACISS